MWKLAELGSKTKSLGSRPQRIGGKISNGWEKQLFFLHKRRKGKKMYVEENKLSMTES